MTARRTGPFALAALAAVTITALSACGTPQPTVPAAASVVPAANAAGGASAGAVSGASGDVTDNGAAAPTQPAGGGTSGGGTSGGGTSGGGTSGGGHSSTPAPAIASFRVISRPSCPVHGTAAAPFSSPGTPVVIAWSVTGAEGAAIAVDNPGLYGAYGSSYPAKGQLELPFACDASGTTTHRYTVWPAGAKSTSTSLSVSARSDG